MIWLAVELPGQPVLTYQTRTGQKRYQVRHTSPGFGGMRRHQWVKSLGCSGTPDSVAEPSVFQIVGLLRKESGCRVPTKRLSLAGGTERVRISFPPAASPLRTRFSSRPEVCGAESAADKLVMIRSE